MSLSRWSNSARSFCRHLARVNGAREPHTRSMGPIARGTSVCRPARDPPRRKLMNEPRRPFREEEIALCHDLCAMKNQSENIDKK